MNEKFIKALKENEVMTIREIPKSDLHNHGIFGGNTSNVGKLINTQLAYLDKKITTLKEMSKSIMVKFPPELYSRNGYANLLECAIEQADLDGVKILEMSIDSCLIDMFIKNDLQGFMEDILDRKNKINPNLDLRPELGIKWEKDLDILHNRIDFYLENGFFKSIDLYGQETSQPAKSFQEVYKKADKKGLKLKAHVGEFGSPDDMFEVIDDLSVSVIQHGIVAVESENLMNYLVENDIQLNICPTSNIMLSRVKSLELHPIEIFFQKGIKVTINTDDMLVFGSSVSQEYLKLFQSGILTAEELDEIREMGLHN